MYGYGYKYSSGLVLGAGAPFLNTYSLDFDGVDDYVIAPLDGTTTGGILPSNSSDIDLTISIWFKKTTNTSMFQWADRLTSGIPFILIAGTATGYRILINNGYQFDAVISSGNWVNVILVRNSTTNVWTHYLNGVALQTYNDGGTLARRLNATDIYLGNGYSSYFNGLIDEVSIWNSDQSANIATLSASPTEDLTSLNPTLWLRNGDNGSYKSPQWLIPSNENKDKVSNYSLSFDGTDDRVQLTSDFVASAEFTISFWMKPTSASGNGNVYIMGRSPLLFDNYIKIDQLSRIKMVVGGSNFFFLEDQQGTNYIVLNTWQNITITRDSANGVRCFRNGLDFGYSGTPIVNSNILTLNAIGRIYSNTFGFNGGLDEIALFNSNETANVATIYNGGEPTTISGAVAHYRLGEEANFSGGVWTVPDAVGSNDGTSNAMTIEDRIGEAPNSENNALSFNMDEVDRTTDVPT